MAITEYGGCEVEVKARIAVTNYAFNKDCVCVKDCCDQLCVQQKTELLRHSISRSTKKRIIKAVGSVVCGPVWL